MNTSTDEEIRARLAELSNIIDESNKEWNRLKIELARRKSAFAEGDVITWKSWRGSKVYKAIVIAIRSGGWFARIIRKDGTQGSQVYVSEYQNPCLETAKPTP